MKLWKLLLLARPYVSDTIISSLARNGLRWHAHVFTHVIFSLGVQLSHTLFTLTDLLGM